MFTGILAFGNAVYDKPWQKVVAGKEKFSQIVEELNSVDQGEALKQRLLHLLKDTTRYVCLFVCLCLCQCVRPPICLFLSVHPFETLFTYPTNCSPVHLCVSVSMSLCGCVYMSMCLCLCVYMQLYPRSTTVSVQFFARSTTGVSNQFTYVYVSMYLCLCVRVYMYIYVCLCQHYPIG